jgi:ATP-dependent exoDNAse (exonuclease V) beta subunit
MEEIYAHIFIDELQDYAGWDLEIFRLLFDSQIFITCVGDYKQATYRTNN